MISIFCSLQNEINELMESSEILSKSNIEYEKIIIDHLAELITTYEEKLLNLPICIFYRIFSKYSRNQQKLSFCNNNEMEKEIIKDFIIKIVTKYGIEASSIFLNLEICKNDISYLNRFMTLFFNSTEYNHNSMQVIHWIFKEMDRKFKKDLEDMKEYFEQKLEEQKLRSEEQKHIVYANMTTITIPSEIEFISDCLFQNCAQLQEIKFPQYIRSFGNNSFSGCSSLTHIRIPPTVLSIGNNTFNGCISLKTIDTGCPVTT